MPLDVFGSFDVVEAFYEAHAVGIKRPKAIWFKHGVLSPGAYINNRVLPSREGIWEDLMYGFYDKAEALRDEWDVVASVATGGTPHGVALAWMMTAPHFTVKKAEKGHGVGGLIDGDVEVLKDKRVLLVEDMSSTFKSSLKAMQPLEAAGAKVTHTLLLNTWGLPDFHQNVGDHQVHALCTGEMILNWMAIKKLIDLDLEATVRHWLNSPEDESWAKEGWEVPPKPASVSDE